MTSQSIVRSAEPGDDMSILALMHQVHQEAGLFPIDVDSALSGIRNGIARKAALIGVIGPVGSVEGAIYLSIQRMWYASDVNGTFINELFLIVDPQHRKSSHAKALMQFAKAAANRLSMKLVIGTASNGRTEAKVRLYRRQFPHKIGEFFIHEASTT